eukprot:GHVP01004352.1.p1 GENE.GHVP01004352.1~~GHVP01004352.1.p1  ORF type:complete len:166 (+),score=22.43 GHVP01004352.1:27-500(+)
MDPFLFFNRENGPVVEFLEEHLIQTTSPSKGEKVSVLPEDCFPVDLKDLCQKGYQARKIKTECFFFKTPIEKHTYHVCNLPAADAKTHQIIKFIASDSDNILHKLIYRRDMERPNLYYRLHTTGIEQTLKLLEKLSTRPPRKSVDFFTEFEVTSDED